MTFYYTDFTPNTGVQSAPVVIRDFSKDFPTFTTGEIMNDVGRSSNDSRWWAWMVMDTARGAGYLPWAIFSYDRVPPRLEGSIQTSCTGAVVPCTVIKTARRGPITRPNMVEMSPWAPVCWLTMTALTPATMMQTSAISDGPKAFPAQLVTQSASVPMQPTLAGHGANFERRGKCCFTEQS